MSLDSGRDIHSKYHKAADICLFLDNVWLPLSPERKILLIYLHEVNISTPGTNRAVLIQEKEQEKANVCHVTSWHGCDYPLMEDEQLHYVNILIFRNKEIPRLALSITENHMKLNVKFQNLKQVWVHIYRAKLLRQLWPNGREIIATYESYFLSVRLIFVPFNKRFI